MKAIFFTILAIIFISCKKDDDHLPVRDNKLDATVVLSSGSIVNIHAASNKALMGCSLLGGGTYVDGTNDANAAIYISLMLNCINAAGTYNYNCEYRPDVSSQTSAIYENTGVSNPGSITFTVFGNHHAEGNFNAVCKAGTDSVTVSGKFSGYYE